jgi:tetratricopeptide (TPR) repeat protein
MLGGSRNSARSIRLILLFACVCSVASWQALSAQEPTQDSQKPSSTEKQKSPKPNTDNATKNSPDQPKWDPLRAEKDMEVGQYYMKRGDWDAAIDRFNDAIEAKPGYAIPFRYLGEAQEKKGLKKQAIKSYTKYLDLVPHADDAEKIQKKVDKLYKEVEKDKK